MSWSCRYLTLRGCSLMLLLTTCIPVTTLAQSDDDRSIRELVTGFFAAYQKEDWKETESLLAVKSSDYAATKEKIQKTFSETEKIEIKNLTIVTVSEDGSIATARISAVMSGVDRKTKTPAEGFGRMDIILRAEKVDGVWKVVKFFTTVEEFAAKLVNAKTDQERNALLAGNEGLVSPELAQAVAALALRFLNGRKYPQAFLTFELARDISAKANDKPGLLIGWRGMGIAQYYQGNYPQSEDYLRKSLALAEEIGDRRKITNLTTNLGILYTDEGETAKALEYFQKSLVSAEALGAKDLTASVLINIGSVYRVQGNYPKALEVLRRSLDLRTELDDKGNAAIALNRIGLVNFDQGNYAEALQYFQTYLGIAKEMGDKGYMNSALFNIGMVYYGQKNFARSLENYQKALTIKEELGDKSGIANTLNALGVVYEGQGDYEKALEYYRKCMALSEPLGFKPFLTSALHNTGNVYLAQGDYSKALEAFQKTLKYCEEMEDKSQIAEALNSIGLVYNKQGNYAQALEYGQKSLSIAESIGEKDMTATALQSMSDTHYDQGSYAKSIEYADRAASMARQVGNLETLWQARTTAGNAHRALNQPELAQQAFDEAIASIESARSTISGGEQQQEQFFENKVSPYQGVIGLLVDQHKDAEALSYAERAKARVLLDVLRSGKVDVDKAMTPQEQERERRMRNALTSVNTQIEREKARSHPDANLLTDLKERLQTARLEFDTFHTNLYAAHPDLRVQRAEARPVTMRELSALVPDSQTALLEYVVADEKTYLFVSTRSGGADKDTAGLKTFALSIKRKDLAEKSAMFRNQLARRDLGFGVLARQLYDLLIKPAQAQLEGKTSLLIVPDGPLWELPFQALQSGQSRFLLEDHAVSYVPSATVLQEMNALRKRRINRPGSANLLAFGNPALGTNTLERVALTRGDEKLLPLPETEPEVKYLSQLYGAAESKVFVAAQASEDRMKSEAPKFTILHLATHGILNDTSPMYSQIVLSQGDPSSNEDGLLEAWEIMKMDLKADLVVLSACETARGRVGAGEGIIGLTWALFVAGSPTNIVSQWKVDSSSTTQLMVEFHRNLKNGLSKAKLETGTAKALQRAAMTLLSTKEYRHPFYWAGFIVMGDGF